MTTIFVTFQQPAFHYWEGASGVRQYLSLIHRHNFHCRVEIEVMHHDREIEVHDLLDTCKVMMWSSFARHLGDIHSLNFEGSSCEALAQMLAGQVQEKFKLPARRWVAVEVSEDGEVGARVEVRG